MAMIRRIGTIRTILIISLALHVVLTFPLITFVFMDGAIRQRIYMHACARFGKYEIAFIGDSITQGGNVWANKIGVYNLNVWNFGAGGFLTEQVAYYAKRVAQNRFKFCFVMCGGNDGLTNDDRISKSYNNYIANLKILTDANVEPIVTLILYRENEKFSKYIDEFNNRIRSYCISNNITVIDLNGFLSDERGLKREYSKDGVHLKDNAYRIWGREINRVLHEKKYL